MEKNIAVIKGDGIGPEIVTESMKVLDKVAEKFGHKFNYTQLLMGGCSIDANGVPLTDETIAACKASDAVLMGSIGGDTTTSPWYKLPSRGRSARYKKSTRTVCKSSSLPALSGACRRLPLKDRDKR